MTRKAQTWSLYAALGALGYVLAGLGAILPELRLERDLPRSEAALYPSGFALGLVVVGLVGERIARRLGRFAVSAAVATLAGGVLILMLGTGRFDTGLGAVLLSLGGAGLVQLVPAALRSLHSWRSTIAIGRANATATAASVVAPLVAGLAIGAGMGWRAAFAVIPLISAALVVVLLGARQRPAAADTDREPTSGRAPPEFWAWWLTIVLVVSVEFCFMFWSADYLRTVTALSATYATGATAGFVLGMAVGRAAVSLVLKVLHEPVRVLVSAAVVALSGFVLFWTAATPAITVAGLLLTGLGVALLYPVTLAEALSSWPSRPIRAASRCALASGLAVGSAPVVLGGLADAAGLRAAFWLVPALLTGLLAQLVRVNRTSAGVSPGTGQGDEQAQHRQRDRDRHHRHALRLAPRDRVQPDRQHEVRDNHPHADHGYGIGNNVDGADTIEREHRDDCVDRDREDAAGSQPGGQDPVLSAPREVPEWSTGREGNLEPRQQREQDDEGDGGDHAAIVLEADGPDLE